LADRKDIQPVKNLAPAVPLWETSADLAYPGVISVKIGWLNKTKTNWL